MINHKNEEFLASFGSADVHEELMRRHRDHELQSATADALAHHPNFDFEKHSHYFKHPKYDDYSYGFEEKHTKDPERIKHFINQDRSAYTLAKHNRHLTMDHYHQLIDRGYGNAVLAGKSREMQKKIFDSYITKSKDEETVSDLAFEGHRYTDLSDHIRSLAKSGKYPTLRNVMATIASTDHEINHIINNGTPKEKFQLVATNPNITHEHLNKIESQQVDHKGIAGAIDIRRTIGREILNPFFRR